LIVSFLFFFFQAEDGIRDRNVTGVQTCALPISRFQLLNERYVDGEKKEFNYTNYEFFNMNFYDYIKGFYRGGLNMYNPQYVATMIDEPCFSIDINSSYPYVMYNEKIPTWLSDYEEF